MKLHNFCINQREEGVPASDPRDAKNLVSLGATSLDGLIRRINVSTEDGVAHRRAVETRILGDELPRTKMLKHIVDSNLSRPTNEDDNDSSGHNSC